MPPRPVRVLLALALALAALAGAPGQAQPPATPVSDQTVHDIALQLRCVVCQNLSVADSPSEMAQQMRAIIRERLAAGERPEAIVRYFVERYGEWILLAPPRRGFTLLVWVVPPPGRPGWPGPGGGAPAAVDARAPVAGAGAGGRRPRHERADPPRAGGRVVPAGRRPRCEPGAGGRRRASGTIPWNRPRPERGGARTETPR